MKKSKKNIDDERKKFVIAALRRASLRWPARNAAKTAARIERGFYQCAHCKKAFGPKEIDLDHVKPIVRISGFTDWHDYIERLLPDESGFQVLCKMDHDIKTMIENNGRKLNKEKNKVDKKKKKG